MSAFIRLYPNNADAWMWRGVYKFVSNNLQGACFDWKRGAELGSEDAQGLLLEECNKSPKVSGSDRAREIAAKFDNEKKSSPKSYTSKYSKVEKNYKTYLKTGNYTLYIEASSKSEVLHKLKGGIYYRVIKKGLSFALIETDDGKKGYVFIYDLKN